MPLMAVVPDESLTWLPGQGSPEQLVLLLHGWASEPKALAPLALALREEFPQAAVVAPMSSIAADMPRRGRQWYSIEGLTPAVWPERVAGVLPMLHDWVREQQQLHGVGPAATALGGFSQGAILALALATQHDGLCGRVLAFGGCFARPPAAAPRHTTLHFFHGGADDIIVADRARTAIAHLGALQGDATIDIAEGIGHEVHPALIDCALHRLRNHIPMRTWREALGALPARPVDDSALPARDDPATGDPA
ncbi:MAG: esterase [Rubrivivax sp.]|nr:esterase [Rubrivivax sp.]